MTSCCTFIQIQLSRSYEYAESGSGLADLVQKVNSVFHRIITVPSFPSVTTSILKCWYYMLTIPYNFLQGVQNPKVSTEVFKCVFDELSLLSNR